MGSFIKLFAKIVGILIVVGAVFGIGSLVYKVALAPLFLANTAVSAASDTAQGVINKTVNADNALDKYRKFHNLHEGMKTHKANFDIYVGKVMEFEKSLKALPYPLWSSDDKDQLAFLKVTRDNFKLAYNRNAAEYNELAERLDSNLFKGWSLPDRIEQLQ
jgi:hypothetical protein